MRNRTSYLFIALGACLLILAALSATTEVSATESVPVAVGNTVNEEAAPKLSNDYCMLCHAKPDRVWTLPSGEKLSLTIDPGVLAKSVHGTANAKGALACADCHVDYKYPHPIQTAQTAREFTLVRYASCRNCHEDQYKANQDSVHGAALRSGRSEAAVCVDCHGAHDIQKPAVPHERISLTCGKCHGAIFEQYRTSVHGTALMSTGNTDVPTCISCHGVHGIQNPTTASFRVRSPELCSQCHADKNLMAKYNISTNVFDSYLTDFHGSTVALFNQQDPKVATNKAVCYDCHGVHNIQEVKKGNAQVVRDNLLTTCRQCHPDATANFPDAWIGHYPATADAHPVLAASKGVYGALLPISLGVFAILIATSLVRRVRRVGGRNQQTGA